MRFQEPRIMAPSTLPIANSDLLQSLLGTQQNLDTAITALPARNNSHEGRSRLRHKCTCRLPAPGSAAHIQRKHLLFHNNGCLLHAPGRRTINLLMRRTICSRLLRFSVTASLQITVGTGGFAINPKLEFCPVVPKNSAAFTLLLGVEESFKTGFNRSGIHDTKRRLFELFYEGEASPLDTLADGRTILHVSKTLVSLSLELHSIPICKRTMII